MINKLMAGVQLAKMEQSDLDTNNFGKKPKLFFMDAMNRFYGQGTGKKGESMGAR